MKKISQKTILLVATLLLLSGGIAAVAYAQYFSPSLLPEASSVKENEILAPLLSVDELHQKIENKDNFLLLDARPAEDFAEEHVKGAINIPLKEIEDHLDELLPFDREIVTMCKGDSCKLSTKAATQLLEDGFTNVKNYDGGIAAWKIKGYPLVQGTK